MRTINQSPTRPGGSARQRPRWESAKGQPVILGVVLLILILAGAVFWYHRAHSVESDAPGVGSQLSDRTLVVLKRLRSPVEIRFYSLLGEADSSDPMQAFAGRVDRLLRDYKQQSEGKIEVTRVDSRSEENLEAAAADGITAFNLDQAEPWFLGLSVVQDDQKESLPRITPDWEEAMEADLTRAILRVTGAESLAAQAEAAALAGSGAVEEVKRSIPDLDAVSLEDGKQTLHDQSLKDAKAEIKAMQAELEQARQLFSEADAAGSEAGKVAAMKKVQEIQAAQAAKLQEISAALKAQITALERLKNAPPSDP
jgi:hypothetical protein